MMSSQGSGQHHQRRQREWGRPSLKEQFNPTKICRGDEENARVRVPNCEPHMVPNSTGHGTLPEGTECQMGRTRGGLEDETAPKRGMIQVAVRCRPRTSRRGSGTSGVDSGGDGIDQDEDDDVGDDQTLPHRSPPKDSVVKYDGHDTAARCGGRFPALLVPSHVLALGGHGPKRRFEFDFVLPPWSQQQDVYEACVFNAVEGVLKSAEIEEPGEGAHATVVAYGQTGTGKTYTMGMLQCTDAQSLHKDHGIIPRAIVHILSRIHAFNSRDGNRHNCARLVVRMSFLQIYLETIQDLLAGEKKTNAQSSASSVASADLQVRLDPVTNVFYVAGLSEFEIEHVDDARMLLERAARLRVLAATARNKASSRSHTLLTLTINRQGTASDRGDSHPAPISTVSFVDLAGSERVEGALHFLHATRKRQELRVREAKFINRSLSALGSVIAALSVNDDRRHNKMAQRGPVVNLHSRNVVGMSPKKAPTQHIRFRDSQLTKLLQSRLVSGNGKLVLIATIDDRPANLTETLSTLKFASQCRQVDASQSAYMKAEAARRRREQSLLQRVFADVKVMYEERERQYASTVHSLEARIQDLEKELEAAPRLAESPGQQQALRAAYVALCSLADLTRAPRDPVEVSHPPIHELRDGSVRHIAQLYQQIKAELAPTPAAAATESRNVPNEAAVVDAPSDVDSSVSESNPGTQSRAIESTQSLNEAKSADAEEVEFLSIARHLHASGQLQVVDVSSDEEETGPHSQL